MASPKVPKRERLQVKVQMKHPAALVWNKSIRDLQTISSLLPGHFKSIKHTQGPPMAPGSIVVASYGPEVSHYKNVKVRWDEIDHQKFSLKATVIDGGALGKHFKHLCYFVKLVPNDRLNTCIVEYTVEYEDIGDHTFHSFIKEEIEKVWNTVNARLSSL